MSNDAIEPGCILHWEGFKFADGAEADKFLVIIGAHPGKNFLAVVATSKMKRGRVPVPGGNVDGGWYHIPGGGKDFFKKDTWLLFEEPRELSAAELLAAKFKNEVKQVGKLRPDVANAICNCMRKCDDVSELHRGLLGPAIQPQAKKK